MIPINVNLNGLWDFVVDLDPKYHRKGESDPPQYAQVNWDRRHWLKVSVPGVWNRYAERLDIYEGVCWFAREFVVDTLPPDSTAILRFGSVNYRCRVFLNGHPIGEHEGGYTEFTMEVSHALVSGSNVLAVEVDNRAAGIRMPGCLGYFNYGGIHRDVSLDIYPDAYLVDPWFDARPDGTLRVLGLAAKAHAGLRVRVTCHEREMIGELSNDRSFDINLAVPGIEPWSPEHPFLYPARIDLLDGDRRIHSITRDVGFRRIEMAGGDIRLNDESVFLKGVCYVYDSPTFGLVMKSEQYHEDLALMKQMGINTIRSHFPYPEDFLDACDQAGLMVWLETPIYCLHPKTEAKNTPFSDAAFVELARTMVEEMIRQVRNHPSVVIYGLGNECNTANPEAAEFFEPLSKRMRELDGSRLLSYAALYCTVGPLAEMVDVLGINEYWGWYDRNVWSPPVSNFKAEAAHPRSNPELEVIDLTKLDEMLRGLKDRHGKPLLLTEFGADSIPHYYARSRELWSEEYHADLIRATFKILERYPQVRGAFPFCFCDYRDPSKWTNGYWDAMNYKGLVSYQRRPKKAFYALQQTYTTWV